MANDLIHERLVEVRTGGPAEWNAFLEELRASFLGQLRRRGISEDLAEDVIQDSLALVYQRFESLRDPAKFRAWSTSILLNRLRSHLSRPDFEDVPESCAGGEDTPLRLLMREEVGGALRSWLAELPATQQEPVRLRLIQGRGPRETSELLGISTVCVRRRIHRALTRLRRLAHTRGGAALLAGR